MGKNYSIWLYLEHLAAAAVIVGRIDWCRNYDDALFGAAVRSSRVRKASAIVPYIFFVYSQLNF